MQDDATTHGMAGLTDAEIAGIARRIDRPIVLVGLMGVGKSTVGRKLAVAVTYRNWNTSAKLLEMAEG